jgi:hypothetical protein
MINLEHCREFSGESVVTFGGQAQEHRRIVKLRSVDDAKRIWNLRKLLQPSCCAASLALWV